MTTNEGKEKIYQIPIRIPRSVREQLRFICRSSGQNQQAFMLSAITDKLAEATKTIDLLWKRERDAILAPPPAKPKRKR